MTTGERKALNSQISGIKILPADKGNTTVVLSTEQYNEKMQQILSDPGYGKLNRDPKVAKERQIKQAIDDD